MCAAVNRCNVFLGPGGFYRTDTFDIKSLSSKTTYSPAHIHYFKRQLNTQDNKVLSNKTGNVRITLV